MSNRYSQHNRNESNKGFPKTLVKFVPKREQSGNQTLSNSLRQSLGGGGGGGGGGVAAKATVSTSRVRLGDNGEWVSSRSQSGNFVNYLPQDEAVAVGRGADEGGLDPVESQRVVDLLNRELSRLLKLKPRDFWKEVAKDTSLHAFLESFLKFRSRWYDFPYRGARGTVAGVIVREFELCRRVFLVLYRISSNRDPGARASDSLSPRDHSAILQENKLLNLPKLLDICAIYAHENEDLTRLLVVNAIKAQPSIHHDFAAVVYKFLSIIQTMYQRCSLSLEVLVASADRHEQGFSQLCADYLEVMDFINDAVVSVDAFVGAYKQAAVFFSCPVEMSSGNEEVLKMLSTLHDSLLPALQRGFFIILAAEKDGISEPSTDMLSNVSISLKMLSTRIVDFGWKLIYLCYLSDEAFGGNYFLPDAMKMFPANVEDPVIRADILLQSLRDIIGDYSDALQRHGRGTILQNMEKKYRMMSRVELLRNTGWISMDDGQLQFLCEILNVPVDANMKEILLQPTSGTGSTLHGDEDTAIIESKISQIKDLFPDYGKGYIVACLEIYNQNPEEVIQRILDGTLHEDLQSLDISLEKMSPCKSGPPVNAHDKGKGKLVESPVIPPGKMIPSTEMNQAGGSSSSSLVGRYIRKGTSELPDSEILDCRDEKDMANTAALALQLEYEDEYDDSFDDLGLGVGDSGLEEAETIGDTSTSNHRRSEEAANGSSTSNASNSKWNSRKKPQFYVKDGKNYSYKVEGSVGVANYNEARLVNQTQKEQIHGLGRGGNIPLGAAKRISESREEQDDTLNTNEGEGRPGPGNFRGRGRRGGGRNHNRKDRAMKKHFSGVGGY